MDGNNFWSVPLLLIPGVGLLILSTSARFGRLHDEFHRLQNDGSSEALSALLERASLIKNSLVALYATVVILSISSLAGTLIQQIAPAVAWAADGLLVLGVVSLSYASLQLLLESMRLYEIFVVERDHQH